MKFEYKQDNGEILAKLSKMDSKALQALFLYADTKAMQLRSHMQINRPWTDRTGEAKRRLNAEASIKDENTVRITLSHGVDYGIWLELAHGQRFAIIQPTINLKSQEIQAGLSNLLSSMS